MKHKTMLPLSISRKLGAVRRWEALLRLLWGVARWVAVVLILLGIACLTDWVIDRYLDTPWAVRVGLFVAQIAIGLYLAYRWLFRPLAGRLSQTDMALLVEAKTPVLQHRLISVVQFHQPNADTGGMSEELIVRVTEETVRQTGGINFTRALDRRRLGWSLATLLPVLALAALPLLLWPALVNILLQRQLLQDVAIPRSVYLASLNRPVEPKGEDVVLRFRVTGGGWTKDSVGRVRIDPEGQPSMYVDMEYEEAAGPGEAVFAAPPRARRDAAKLPTISNITYRAWLADGRTASAEQMRFEPRPVIDAQQIRARVLLPPYCPHRPDGQPYEIDQPRGDIVALDGAAARVQIRIQKRVKKALLHVLGPAALEDNPLVLTSMLGLSRGGAGLGWLATSSLPAAFSSAKHLQQQLLGAEVLLLEVPMELQGDGDEAEAVFGLPATATGYRLIVEDEYGFANIPAPRRSIRMVTEEPPQVAMLPVIFDAGGPFGLAEDFPMDGFPIPPGGKFRVAYSCGAPFGLGGARLHYRVLKLKAGADPGSADTVATDWLKLPLIERAATASSGPFLPHRGIFKNSDDYEQVQFHAVPSFDPALFLGRKVGGGRFDFHTAQFLKDHRGNPIPLAPGDQIEYKVEVFPAGPDSKADKSGLRATGFSETRTVSVVSIKEWTDRLALYEQETAKLRKIKSEQGKVFPR